MQLDIPSLRALLAVLDHGGMTRAGEELGLSQSAVSWKIRRLEERVGRPLLVRDGHSVRPTKDGEEIVGYARTIVDLHDEAVARLVASDLVGRVRIGANEETSVTQLADLLGRFDRVHPGAKVELHIDRSPALAARISAGDLDVAVFEVTEAAALPADRVLWTYDIGWIVSPMAPPFDPPVPLVSFGSDCPYYALATAALDRVGVAHRLSFSGPSNTSVEAAVRAGLGVAVMSLPQVGEGLVRWQPDGDPGPPLPVMAQVVRTARGEGNPVVDALVDELVAELSKPS